jgi:pseudouridine kinase
MKRVCVIGGSVIDLFLYPHQHMNLKDSNPGYMKRSLGGVGRNIAENLSRLGVQTTLVTPLGQDHHRKMIENQAYEIGLKLCPIEIKETPLYVSIIDEKGEDLIGVALMDEIASMSIESIMVYQQDLEQADMIVLDTNLSEEVLTTLLELYGHKSYVDAISGQKAIRLKHTLSYIHTLKMNHIEATMIAGFGDDSLKGLDLLGQYFMEQGTTEIFITMGEKGVYYANKDMAQFRSSIKVDVINSTGAGDAFFAGVIFAKIHGFDALSYGIANACINLTDAHAVCDTLSKEKIIQFVKELNL